jgi:Ala-tRNA(Pro) deacylase
LIRFWIMNIQSSIGGMLFMNEKVEALLIDENRPVSPKQLLDRLIELGIKASTIEHPRVYTVEQSRALRGEIAGCHSKNLFLRNKKGVMWLVVCLENRKVDLKATAKCLGAGRFSFGNPERLMKYLGVVPGAVSPFSIINDRTQQVRIALDLDMLDCEILNFHPLDNAMTTSIKTEDFLSFLEAENHLPTTIDFETWKMVKG